jgi:hypothetical protein
MDTLKPGETTPSPEPTPKTSALRHYAIGLVIFSLPRFSRKIRPNVTTFA